MNGNQQIKTEGIFLAIIAALVFFTLTGLTTDQIASAAPIGGRLAARPAGELTSPIRTFALNRAPAYCPSSGGSTAYEDLTYIKLRHLPFEPYRLLVPVHISNPAGCTAGTPCPSYDNSPEYVNAWMDWNHDDAWSAAESVMDLALTGYLAISYHGNMNGVSEFTPPLGAGSTPTMLRTNLGWNHDPNDPCEASWTWGDVLDTGIHPNPPVINSLTARGVGTTGNEPTTGSAVRLEADISIPAGYELLTCSWTGDITPGSGDTANHCRYEYTPATGAV